MTTEKPDNSTRIRTTYRVVPVEGVPPLRFKPIWRGDDYTEAEARAYAERFYPGYEFQKKTDLVTRVPVSAPSHRTTVKKHTDWRRA